MQPPPIVQYRDMDTPHQILIVEDDAKLARLIQEFLRKEGFAVEIEPRGDLAPARILSENPDLVLLDLMLPGMDGLSICREVRPRYDRAIIMLTARGEEVDEVVGLELGADDYVIKPVRPRALLARINTLLRRAPAVSASEETPDEPARIQIGALAVDAANRTVHLGDAPVELTTAEFDLLWFLAQNAGQVVSRERIYAEVRGIEYDGIDRSVDLRVARLRRKLGDTGKQPRRIKSVRGAGYLLAEVP